MSRRPPAPDFRLLFESAPGCYLVLDPHLRIVAVSDAYLTATMTERARIVGRGLFEVFPDNPDDPNATGVANLRASLARVVEHRRPDAMAAQKYDIRRPLAEGGGFEERHWLPVNWPVLGQDGRVAYVIHRVEDVSERVRLERKSLEQGTAMQELSARSEDRYRQLLDAGPDAIVVVDSHGRIELVNAETERMFGYARSELVGQRLTLLLPERFRAAHAGHEARFFESPSSRTMGSGLELYGRRKDGVELPVEVSLSPLRTPTGITVSASIRDTSERRRLEATARLTSERLASAVESIQDAFALFDDEDRLVLCNSVYRRLVGDVIPGALLGRTYEELLGAWSREIAFKDEAARESFRRERLSKRHDEQTTSFDVHMRDGRSLRVIDRRTAEGGIVKTIWDLTDDERRSEELRAARAAAEAGSAAKSEFLSSMSHELRTPLNAILGFAQLLQRDRKEPLSARHLERVDQILKGGEHLLRLIDDILDLSRIEAGGVSVSVEPVSVLDVLVEVKSALEPMAAQQDIDLQLAALPASSPMVSVDRTRFAQIVMNFASNAIKYNRPAGRVTFEVTTPHAAQVRVAVRDTGLGIPAEAQAKLFQPFQRAGQETGPIEGTGIGLVISRRLAQLMGGDVGFRSGVGEGSVFWVDVPVHAAVARPSEPPRASRGEGPRMPLTAPRPVLYVEDNPANVRFMRDLVTTFEGVQLLVATTAETGVTLAREARPSAIIMDINLPGMSGLDALRALRADPATMGIPVIALTAAASERDRHKGVQAGFFRYLTKPVKVDELVDALELCLHPHP